MSLCYMGVFLVLLGLNTQMGGEGSLLVNSLKNGKRGGTFVKKANRVLLMIKKIKSLVVLNATGGLVHQFVQKRSQNQLYTI